MASHWKRRLVVGLKLIVVLAVVWGIRRSLLVALDELADADWRFSYGWLLLAGLLYLGGLFPAGLIWYRALRVLGEPVRLWPALRAYYVGHLGKYVPGKAMVFVLRIGLLPNRQSDIAIVTIGVFYETVTMMAVGASLAAGILAASLGVRRSSALAAAGLALLLALPTLPPVFRRLARLGTLGKLDREAGQAVDRLGYSVFLTSWLASSVSWVMIGMSFWATARALPVSQPVPLSDLPFYIACAGLAIAAGFVSLIPGGAVIREAVFMELLIPRFGAATAVVAAILVRLVWLVAEAAISVILYGLGWRYGRNTKRPAEGGRG